MMKIFTSYLFTAGLLLFVSCSKKDQVSISSQEFMAGSFIQDGDTLNSKNGSNGRAIKGTLQAGETYYLSSDFSDATVNSGDTLVVQSGVKVLVVGPSSGANAIGTEGHAPALLINGVFLCLGTKAKPILFSVADPALKSDPAKDPQDPNTDPAFKGYWGGIQGGAGCGDIIIKWTRLEYLGGIAPATAASRPGQARYGIFVNNPSANFVLEDCWLYGSKNDMVRPAGCKFEIFRNTFEKVGFTAGECVNVKSGSVGDIAYNLVIGGTGNAFKSANAGGLSPQSNMNAYNNTVITTGFRQAKAGEGGSIDFENGGRGMAYNNLLVDCAYGLGVRGGGGTTPAADTINTKYGYTYNYGENVSMTTQFLPVGFITVQQPSDINGGNATTPGANNPSFVNYSLPLPATVNFNSANYAGGYDFHLRLNSPAIGKGNIAFTPYAVVKVDPVFGVTEITFPGKDIGAFQTNGSGNQH
ncbi:MAG: hypothetical protein J0H07_02600 [Sphingobacteriales bacterium]|nr:hypothetical protein [Sphingobacteriales bacterium]